MIRCIQGQNLNALEELYLILSPTSNKAQSKPLSAREEALPPKATIKSPQMLRVNRILSLKITNHNPRLKFENL